MKLAAAVLASLLGLAPAAFADDYAGPPGAMTAPPPPPAQMAGQRGPRGELRQALLDRFDRNHDGRLDPNERRHAARALRRLARKLDRGMQKGQREARMRQRLIKRYDLDGDGNVGPGEMPPEMARRLRRLDRNGDGWLDGADTAP